VQGGGHAEKVNESGYGRRAAILVRALEWRRDPEKEWLGKETESAIRKSLGKRVWWQWRRCNFFRLSCFSNMYSL